MAARSIGEGDKVRIYMSTESNLWLITTQVIWTVNWTPGEVGELWTLEHNGQVIKINSMSANFDGLELVGKAGMP